jgi:UDP-N-acetylglucosamine 2-epimerase (non-hydrolysing)
MVSAIADVHFAPTSTAKQNLINEGIHPENIWITGNTVIDALLSVIAKLSDDVNLKNKQDHFFSFLNPLKKLILVTGHRRENFGGGFIEICHALKNISSRGDVEIIYPVHLNPNVQEPVLKILGNLENVHLIEPLEYLPFVYLMNRAHLIVTDSGGVQEEAPSLGKPVLVMRDVTERPEAVEAGTVRLIGNKTEVMVREIGSLLDDAEAYEKMSHLNNPYGNGCASREISEIIKSKFIGG